MIPWDMIWEVVKVVLRELVGANPTTFNAGKEVEVQAERAAKAETSLADEIAAGVAQHRREEEDAKAIAARRAVDDERLRDNAAGGSGEEPADDGFCIDCGPATLPSVAADPVVKDVAEVGH